MKHTWKVLVPCLHSEETLVEGVQSLEDRAAGASRRTADSPSSCQRDVSASLGIDRRRQGSQWSFGRKRHEFTSAPSLSSYKESTVDLRESPN